MERRMKSPFASCIADLRASANIIHTIGNLRPTHTSWNFTIEFEELHVEELAACLKPSQHCERSQPLGPKSKS